MTEILVLYYSRHGGTRNIARLIARGIEAQGAVARLRTVPEIASAGEPLPASEPSDPLVTLEDLATCDGLAMGSPVRFGNMAAPLKHFIDSSAKAWLAGTLIGKPAMVFTSGSMLHGGQETTLQSMMLPLLHHGMVIVGLPHSEPALHTTQGGGSPYGPSHVTSEDRRTADADEKSLALAAGRRLAHIASRLKD